MLNWDYQWTSKLGELTDGKPTLAAIFEFIARWVLPLMFGVFLIVSSQMQDRALLLLVLVAVIGSYVMTLVISYAVRRKRPYETQTMADGYFMKPWVYTPSFPSGHAAASFALAGALLLGGAPTAIVIILFLLAIIVTLSRVIVSVHYVSDVMVGAVVGLFMNVFIFWIYPALMSTL